MTEEQAKAAGHDVVVSKHRYNGNSRAMIIGEAEGLVKVIAETVNDVAQFIQPHPTLSELYGETVLGLTGRSLH